MRWDVRQKRISKKGTDRINYQNPLFTKNNWRVFIIHRFSFFGWLAILALLIVVYAIFYSPLFQITKINIDGISYQESKILDEKVVRWQLEQKKWLIFKQGNVMMFSKSWLLENIEDKYDPESIEIDKKIPHTLSITIKKRDPSLIWISNEKQYYLEASGIVSSLIENSESILSLPHIIDETNEPVQPGMAILTNEKISFINNLISQLESIESITPTSYSIPHRLGPRLNAKTENGFDIYFDMSKDINIQIEKLQRLLNELDPGARPNEYIDLRIGERVYYK